MVMPRVGSRGLLVIYAPTKEDVLKINGKIPRTIKDYTILVLRPDLKVESVEELVESLSETAKEMVQKHKKKVYSYVN